MLGEVVSGVFRFVSVSQSSINHVFRRAELQRQVRPPSPFPFLPTHICLTSLITEKQPRRTFQMVMYAPPLSFQLHPILPNVLHRSLDHVNGHASS